MSDSPVAVITGGGSGIGLATVNRLLELEWLVAVIDLKPAKTTENKTSGEIPFFVRGDVSKYEDQGAAFSQIYQKWGRIDLVFANAGILDRADFCAQQETTGSEPPLKPDVAVVDIDLYGIIWSSYLAFHYFRKNNSGAGKLIMTSSTAGIYAISEVPLYAAAKHGVVGLARSLGKRMKEENEPITVNAIIPGTVPTNILPESLLKAMPPQYLTQASVIVEAIEQIINDDSITGQAIECSGTDIVPRPPLPFVNEACDYTAGGKHREVVGDEAVRNHGLQSGSHPH